MHEMKMFKVVAMIFQQIITELNGAKSEEDRTMGIIKNCIKTLQKMAARAHRQ
jgi:hypothetical protein